MIEFVIRSAKLSPHVQWFDNYSDFVARTNPSLDKGIFSSCLWTGSAIFECPDATIDSSLQYSDNQLVPAMPANPFVGINNVKGAISAIILRGPSYYELAMVTKYTVNNVPLKINTNVYPAMTGLMKHPLNDLSHVIPDKLWENNIGSHIGLVNIMKQVYDENGMGVDGHCSQYLNLNTDENIFYRLLKVCICILNIYSYFFCIHHQKVIHIHITLTFC